VIHLPRPFRAPFIGLDIGSSAVKGVVLRQSRGGWTLIAAAAAPVPEGAFSADVTAAPDAVAESVRQVCEALHVRRARVVTGLSGHAVIVKRLSVPAMTDAELAEAIPWEAEQYIPFDLSEVHLDYQVLGSGSGDPRGLREESNGLNVLLVAAKRDRIAERADVITRAGRQAAVLDVEAFALANAYQLNYPERNDPLAALVHVGRHATIVCLLDRGQPAFTRDIAFGGQSHTDALMRDLNVDALTAERMKHGHLPPDVSADPVTAVLREASSQLVLEIRKTVDFFRATAPIERLSRVVISGGAWRAAGLADLLGTEFDTPVEVFDPFRRIARSRRSPVGHGDGPGPEYAVAVGLAMRQEVA
jgi:type IV pilus assembly protein PilM